MNQLKDIEKLIASVLKGGDLLFIVPPFARREFSVLGPHVLQSIARETGYKTDILYLTILLASIWGDETYDRTIAFPFNQRGLKLGERLFARSAHGLPPLGKSPEPDVAKLKGFHLDELFKLEEICFSFVNETVKAIASLNYKIIGCTTELEQTNCSVAILKGVKKIRPDIITLIGGTDCEGEMAEGIASLAEEIDYVFSGESERSLKEFLEGYAEGKLPAQRIITGEPLMDMDTLTLPDYESFFEQTKQFRGDNLPKLIGINYETSRGCWWGQKEQCRFCGFFNKECVNYRHKSGKKVMKDIESIADKYPTCWLVMSDSIVPPPFYKKMFPILAQDPKFPPILYQEIPILSLKDLINLKQARIKEIQVGIESLSNGLLKLMNKRLKACQNLLMLRNGLSAGLYVIWHMLWGFPGDKVNHYRETLELLPLIQHLQPPNELVHLKIERFSTYVENAQRHRITRLRPLEIYKQVYPDWADINKLAYEFTGDYPCEAHENPELIEEIAAAVAMWKKSWEKINLNMIHMAGQYCIFDSRKIHGQDRTFTMDYNQAKEVMKYDVYSGSEPQKWAVEEKLGVVIDSQYVPLVTASPELLLQFENR